MLFLGFFTYLLFFSPKFFRPFGAIFYSNNTIMFVFSQHGSSDNSLIQLLEAVVPNIIIIIYTSMARAARNFLEWCYFSMVFPLEIRYYCVQINHGK